MARAMPFESDDALRSKLRERPFFAHLVTLVARRRHAANLALRWGDLEHAAALEEHVALAEHRLGLVEDSMVEIVHGCRADRLATLRRAYPGLGPAPTIRRQR